MLLFRYDTLDFYNRTIPPDFKGGCTELSYLLRALVVETVPADTYFTVKTGLVKALQTVFELFFCSSPDSVGHYTVKHKTVPNGKGGNFKQKIQV